MKTTVITGDHVASTLHNSGYNMYNKNVAEVYRFESQSCNVDEKCSAVKNRVLLTSHFSLFYLILVI